jgi:hypothetical protein
MPPSRAPRAPHKKGVRVYSQGPDAGRLQLLELGQHLLGEVEGLARRVQLEQHLRLVQAQQEQRPGPDRGARRRLLRAAQPLARFKRLGPVRHLDDAARARQAHQRVALGHGFGVQRLQALQGPGRIHLFHHHAAHVAGLPPEWGSVGGEHDLTREGQQP